jgi:glycosyltransferase involved in cell wall biosynthesis
LKILFIHNRYQYAGGEDAMLLMEKTALETHGHETEVLEFDNQQIDSLASKIRTGLASFYNRQSAKRLKETVRRFRPDLIHVHNLFFTASPSVLFQAARMKVPVVMTIHNFRLICANALLLRDNQVCELCVQKKFPLHGIKYKCYRSSAIESALVTAITGAHKLLHTWQNKTSRIIVLSSFMKEKLLSSSLGVAGDKLAIKANFVTDTGIGDNQREDFYLFAGRLSKEKGIGVLLKAFLDEPGRRLVIAGDGPEKEALAEAIKDAPWIRYVGLQSKENILALMKKCKALLFTSVWYEGMPTTILESFSTGTPVISSRIGAMTELVEDGVNGFHFTAGDPADLKRCLEKFDTDAGKRLLYDNARQTYLDKYTPAAHYAAIMKLYKEVITDAQLTL